jgi:hypothetical protein
MHHRAGDERVWWKAAGIDPLKVAHKLWKEARLNEGRIAAGAPPGDQGQIPEAREPSGPAPA